MSAEKVLYTDGRGITVTESTFQVHKTLYHIDGITQHGLFVLRPERIPGMLLLIVGFLVAIVGILGLIPAYLVADVELNGQTVNANVVALWAGAAVAVIGLLILFIVRERYAVRISTAEGEKNAVVSDKKEYISQIVNALDDAFSNHKVQPLPHRH